MYPLEETESQLGCLRFIISIGELFGTLELCSDGNRASLSLKFNHIINIISY